MEALLALAFDNLSSYDGPKVRKGLRQVEGLLAQICLSPSSSPSGSKSPLKKSSTADDSTAASEASAPPPRNRTLSEVSGDPAFREFFKLQDGFEWNVMLRLVGTLDRLLAKGSDGQNDLLILAALDLVQGVLLLHPPSKSIFGRDVYMNMLLDLLEPVNCPAIQSATLLTLVVALVGCPSNARSFESLDGLLTVTSLFKSRATSRDVKLRIVEFLYFYLMPESAPPPVAKVPAASMPAGGNRGHQRAGSKLGGGGGTAAADLAPARPYQKGATVAEFEVGGDGADAQEEVDPYTLTTEEKQELLGRHLSSVEDLVKDLRNCTPFGGGVVC